MDDWVSSGLPAWLWVTAGVALAAVEILLPSFFMLWLGISAVIVGVVSLFLPFDLAAQLFLWAVLSLSCLVAWFRWVAPRMKDKSHSGMAYETLIGQTATVLEFNNATGPRPVAFSCAVTGRRRVAVYLPGGRQVGGPGGC